MSGSGAILRRLALAGAAATALASSALVSVGVPAGASPLAARSSAAAAPPTAENLVLSAPLVVELVDADAAFKRLPADDFVGIRSAYYAYDPATATYWAAAAVVPSQTAYQAEVASQDDGGYTVFHELAHSSWVAADDGLGTNAATCANYHVSIPPAVLAVWHWPAHTCTPPNDSGALLLTYYAEARQQWWSGSTSVSAGEGAHWLRAAHDLEAALTAKAPGTSGYAAAAAELTKLSKLPDAMLSAAQSNELGTFTASLDAFFDANGLYGYSAPSRTPKAFVATLAQEADLGTLNVLADPRLGKVPSSLSGALVSCPIVGGVGSGSVFGCKLQTYDTYFMVGRVEAADATSYSAYLVEGRPLFDCATDGLSLAEELVAKRMGGGCES
ncbi:MAG TPA: hypothetical protein VMD59_05545 [Acidimicrobiales bacterium]|nr:hypothetical protein [Acidimicrobiales bacterium]